ncbi:MAG: hypothetical protein AB7E55_17875 [Pigmentiphaga sp.]
MIQDIEAIFLPLFLIGAPIVLLMAPALIAAAGMLIGVCFKAAWLKFGGT